MVLGAIWCPKDRVKEINKEIRSIKKRHDLNPYLEIKWTKVSRAKVDFYKNIIDYFFDNNSLHFRALVVPDKSKLSHQAFNQSHDEWYYKMYFNLINVIIDPKLNYNIYLDYKDTTGSMKVSKLHEILASANYDFLNATVQKIQTVRSHEIEILQLTDLITGAISYINRDLSSSSAKLDIINQIRYRSGYSLTRTTLVKEEKLNIFKWRAQVV
jgi:hypothetical protein